MDSKWFLIAFIVVIVIAFSIWFYWEKIRVSKIVKKCDKMVSEFLNSEETALRIPDMSDKDYKWYYEFLFERCRRLNGLK